MNLQDSITASMDWIGAEIVLRSSLILLCTAILAVLLKRQSAAARHLAWTMALVGVFILPAFLICAPRVAVLPAWTISSAIKHRDATSITTTDFAHDEKSTLPEIGISPAGDVPETAFTRVNETERIDGESAVAVVDLDQPVQLLSGEMQARQGESIWFSRSNLLGMWSLGSFVMLLPIFLGLASLWRIQRCALPVTTETTDLINSLAAELFIERPMIGLVTAERKIPMTWGTQRPIVLLPIESQSWSRERLRLVLLHELAHIQRHDYATQLIGQVARALYWFNPFVWWALNQLHLEQEQACDDVVLNNGIGPDEYAAELMSVTTNTPRCLWDASVALGIGRAARIERRVESILDERSDRRTLSRVRTLSSLMVFTGLFVVLSLVSHRKADAVDPPTEAPDQQLPTAAQEKIETATKDANQPEKVAPVPTKATDVDERTRKIVELLRTIENVTGNSIDAQRLEAGAIRGIVDSLQDPYSGVFTDEELRALNQMSSGKMVGIGVVLERRGEQSLVLRTFPNSSASLAGIKPNEEIVAVDGDEVKELGDTVQRIRGPAGSRLTLRLRAYRSV